MTNRNQESPVRNRGIAAAIFILAISTGPALAEPLPVAELKRTDPVNFATEVYPFLKANCLACHNSTKSKAGLILESPKQMIKGGDSGPAIAPGDGANSFLFTTARHEEEPTMPPTNNKSKAQNLNPQQLALLKLWIDQGAKGDAVSTAAPTEWTLLTGAQPIYTSSISGDGRFAVAGRGQQIHVYDLRLKRLAAALTDPALEHPAAHRDLVHAVSFSPTGQLASGGYRIAKIWERSEAEAGVTAALPHDPTALTLSPDRKWAAAGSADGSITLLALNQTDAKAVSVKDHAGAVTGIAFSPDNASVLSISADKTVRKRTLADPSKSVKLDLPAPGNAIAVIDAGKKIAVAGADNIIRIAEVAKIGAPPAAPAPPKTAPPAPAPAAAPKPGEAAPAPAPAAPPAAAPAPVPLFTELKVHSKPVTAISAVKADGSEFLSASEDGLVIHWKTEGNAEIRRLTHGTPVAFLAVAPDGARAATAGKEGSVKLWTLADGKMIADIKGDPQIAPQIAELQRASAVALRLKAHWDKKAPEAEKRWKDETEKAQQAAEAIAKARRDIVAKRTEYAKVESAHPKDLETNLAKAEADAAAAEAAIVANTAKVEPATAAAKAAADKATAAATAAKAAADKVPVAAAAAKTATDKATAAAAAAKAATEKATAAAAAHKLAADKATAAKAAHEAANAKATKATAATAAAKTNADKAAAAALASKTAADKAVATATTAKTGADQAAAAAAAKAAAEKTPEAMAAAKAAADKAAAAATALQAASANATTAAAAHKKAAENAVAAAAAHKAATDQAAKETASALAAKTAADKAVAAATPAKDATAKAAAAANAAMVEADKVAATATAAKAEADKIAAAAAAAKVAADKASMAAAVNKAAIDKALADAKTAKASADAAFKTAEKTKTDADKILTDAKDALTKAERDLAGAERNRDLSVRLAGDALAEQTGALASSKEAEATDIALKAEVEALNKTLLEVEKAILTAGISFSADGATLAQSLPDGTVRLWAAETGEWLENFSTVGEVLQVTFNGTDRLLTARKDRNLASWSLPGATWNLAKTLGDGIQPDPFSDRVTALAFNQQGTRLATGTGVPSRSGQIKLWNTEDWTVAVENDEAHKDTITSFAFSPYGKELASGSTDRMIRIFNTDDLKPVKTFEGHTSHVLDVAWNTDGLNIASASADLQVKIWDVAEGQQKQKIEGYDKQITSIEYVADNTTLLTASGDKSLKLSNAPLPEAGDTFLHTCAASPDGKTIVAGGQDGVLRVWDAPTKKLLTAFEAPGSEKDKVASE